MSMAFASAGARASERVFAYTKESHVHAPGESALEPQTTYRVGRERYYSELEGRLELEHGLTPGLQLGLYWNFATRTQDVVTDELTGELSRVSESQLASASFELKYQLSDPSADVVGSALYVETTLGPSASLLEAKLIVDRWLGRFRLAGNLAVEYELAPVRAVDGSKLQTALVLEPYLGASYGLGRGFGVGLELRAPLALSGDGGRLLFGGPALTFADQSFWLTLGVQPQLLAFSEKTANSRLDLSRHERVELRVLAGFLL